jgi:hypothetical protein
MLLKLTSTLDICFLICGPLTIFSTLKLIMQPARQFAMPALERGLQTFNKAKTVK